MSEKGEKGVKLRAFLVVKPEELEALEVELVEGAGETSFREWVESTLRENVESEVEREMFSLVHVPSGRRLVPKSITSRALEPGEVAPLPTLRVTDESGEVIFEGQLEGSVDEDGDAFEWCADFEGESE